jgi:integrase
MPRGQKIGWKERQLPKEKPEKAVKLEAGLWLQPSGRIAVFVYQRRRSVYLGVCGTVEAGRQLRSEAKRGIKNGLPPAPRTATKVTLAEFFERTYFAEVIEPLVEGDDATRKKSTLRTTKSRYRRHVREQIGSTPMSEVTYDLLSAFRAELLKKTVSGQTKREVLSLVRRALDDAVNRGLLPMNPARLLSNPPKRPIRIEIPEVVQVKKVIAGIADPMARMIAETLFRTGLRINECLALQHHDWDLKHKTLTVQRSVDQATAEILLPKTSQSIRTIDVPESLIKMYRKYRRGQVAQKIHCHDPWCFPARSDAPEGRPYNDRNFVQRHFEPAVRAAGVAHLTPHGLRHVFASLLLQRGAEILYVARQLGHRDPAFTLRQYAHLLARSSPSRVMLDAAFAK